MLASSPGGHYSSAKFFDHLLRFTGQLMQLTAHQQQFFAPLRRQTPL